ncbi:hypothetical protein BHE74_00051183 [Ensete ventricosum]|nr:hypothetical protein BHE74_00051183 [Ensete ventricosum]RZS06637.1 hypothetical protein BHM03_00037323 [Ensete ventricosum]
MAIVSPRLPQRDVYSLLMASPWCYHALLSVPTLWEHLMKNSREVVSLNLSGCKILLKCSSLRSLNLYALSRCVRVTDVGVAAIAEGCRSLELLR